LNILNAHIHGNYVVLACAYQLASWNTRHSPFISTFLLLLHLHRQLIGTFTQRYSHHLTTSVLFKHVLGYFLGFNFSKTVTWSLLGVGEDRSSRFQEFFNSNFGVTLFLLRLVSFLFLLLGFTLDFSKSISITGGEIFVMEVAFLAVFPYFVEVVHVELNVLRGTCLTKDE